jgi:hypothetical protein
MFWSVFPGSEIPGTLPPNRVVVQNPQILLVVFLPRLVPISLGVAYRQRMPSKTFPDSPNIWLLILDPRWPYGCMWWEPGGNQQRGLTESEAREFGLLDRAP